MDAIVPIEVIEKKIYLIRGHKVMLDTDLAVLSGVTTKRLNEQVKRNSDRFPEDFMFQLNEKEKAEVVAICDHLRRLKFSPKLPYAFTEHGAIMLAAVLNSPIAVQASIQVVRVFVRLRQMLASNAELSRKLDTLEKKYDYQFKIVFDAIRHILPPAQVINTFERFATAIDDKIANNDQESCELAAIRDVILPKLISGKLGEPEAEKLLEKIV